MSPSYIRHTLENGLRVVTIPMPHAYSVTAALYFGVGSRYEPDEVAGISHLIEHVLFKGTTRRPTSRDIVLSIEGVGGVFNAGTGREVTHYWAQAAHFHLETIVDTLFDIARHSLFRPEDVTKEQQVIVEEINEMLDMPAEVVAMNGYEALYPNHPLGRDIAGTRESVSAISLEQIQHFLATHYVPANAALIVAGAVSPEQVVTLAGRHAGDWHPERRTPASHVTPVPTLPAGPHIRAETRSIEQMHLFMAVRGYDRHHPDRYALTLLNAILGEGMASRLFLRIREDLGLAYTIGSGLSFYDDTGDLYIEASVDPDTSRETLRAVREELMRMRDEPIAPAEVDTMREYVKGRLMLSLESTYANASWYGTQELLYDEIMEPREMLRRLDDIIEEDVQRVAREILQRETVVLSVLGPGADATDWETFL